MSNRSLKGLAFGALLIFLSTVVAFICIYPSNAWNGSTQSFSISTLKVDYYDIHNVLHSFDGFSSTPSLSQDMYSLYWQEEGHYITGYRIYFDVLDDMRGSSVDEDYYYSIDFTFPIDNSVGKNYGNVYFGSVGFIDNNGKWIQLDCSTFITQFTDTTYTLAFLNNADHDYIYVDTSLPNNFFVDIRFITPYDASFNPFNFSFKGGYLMTLEEANRYFGPYDSFTTEGFPDVFGNQTGTLDIDQSSISGLTDFGSQFDALADGYRFSAVFATIPATLNPFIASFFNNNTVFGVICTLTVVSFAGMLLFKLLRRVHLN